MYHINSKIDKPDINYLYTRVSEMMKSGIKVVSNLASIHQMFFNEQEAYKQDILVKYGIKNPNSAQQVIAYLKSIDNPKVVDICMKDGKWTSNKDAMLEVSGLGYEFATDIIQYRTAKKYAESLYKLLELKDKSNLIHPTVSMTKTNRISYSNPALMNIPKSLLWNVIAPSKPGNKLISVDIKNQEPSILINALNIQSLKKAIQSEKGLYEEMFSHIPIKCNINIIVSDCEKEEILDNSELATHSKIPTRYYSPKYPEVPGTYLVRKDGSIGNCIKYIDIVNIATPKGHIPTLPDSVAVEDGFGGVVEVPIVINVDTSSKTFKSTIENGGIIELEGELQGLYLECKGVARSEFKRAWNAMTYGASIMGVRQMCSLLDGDTIYHYIAKIPELATYRSYCKKLANSRILESKTFFNTPITIDKADISRLHRIHMDVPIQGTASDILALLVKHFDIEAKKYNNLIKVYYTRHDELIIEVDNDFYNQLGWEKVESLLREILEHQVNDWEPFKIEVKEVEPIDISTLIGIGIEEEE